MCSFSLKVKHSVFVNNEDTLWYFCLAIWTGCIGTPFQILIIKIVQAQVNRTSNEIIKYVAAIWTFNNDWFRGHCHNSHSWLEQIYFRKWWLIMLKQWVLAWIRDACEVMDDLGGDWHVLFLHIEP